MTTRARGRIRALGSNMAEMHPILWTRLAIEGWAMSM